MYVFMYLATSDVQAVNATVVGESTIDIQCWFIHGSDALGCKVVLVSDCPNISDVHVNLSRSDMSASGQLTTLPAIIECLHLTLMSTTLSVINWGISPSSQQY